MAVARKITARVVPITTAKELTAALATTVAAAAGIDTAIVVTAGQAANAAGTVTERIGKGFSHMFVTTDKENLASTAKTNLDAAIAASGLGYSGVSGAVSPLLEHNDADNAVSISRAAGATTVRYTATVVSPATNANGLIWTLDTGGILATSITVTDISAGVKDYAIDLAAGDSAGPYTVVVTVTDPNTGLSASADLVVTSTA
jgi:hypothetical protein